MQLDKNIVFMGSPEFAVPILEVLHKHFSVVGVVSQPDRPAGRGRVMTQCPVQRYAAAHEIPTMQPGKLYRNSFALEQLAAWRPDVIVVAAYGKVLREEVLDLPQYGCINVHASLLPRWRGASPIQAAIYHGDDYTGISIMKMDAGLDTGNILSQERLPIEPFDTAGSLESKLSLLGAELLAATLPKYFSSDIQLTIQDESQATYMSSMKKSDGKMDFQQPAVVLERMVRAYHPWPGSFTYLNQHPLKIHHVEISNSEESLPGKMKIINGYPAVGAKNGWLILRELQPAGKKKMDGKNFLMGHRQWDGFLDGYKGS